MALSSSSSSSIDQHATILLQIFTYVLLLSSSVHGARQLYRDTVTGEFGDILINAENSRLAGFGNRVFIPVAPIRNFKYFGDPRKTAINVSRLFVSLLTKLRT